MIPQQTTQRKNTIQDALDQLVELFADPCSEEARVSCGLTLRTADGVKVVQCRGGDAAGWVGGRAYGHPAKLADGRSGILRDDIPPISPRRFWLDMTVSPLQMLLALMANGFHYSDAEWGVVRTLGLNAEKLAQLRDEYDVLSDVR